MDESRKIDNRSNMKRLLYILTLATIFIGCATSKKAKPCKQCPSYTIEAIPITDTIRIPSLHYHYEDECFCVWIPEYTFAIEDTIYIEYLNTLK